MARVYDPELTAQSGEVEVKTRKSPEMKTENKVAVDPSLLKEAEEKDKSKIRVIKQQISEMPSHEEVTAITPKPAAKPAKQGMWGRLKTWFSGVPQEMTEDYKKEVAKDKKEGEELFKHYKKNEKQLGEAGKKRELQTKQARAEMQFFAEGDKMNEIKTAPDETNFDNEEIELSEADIEEIPATVDEKVDEVEEVGQKLDRMHEKNKTHHNVATVEPSGLGEDADAEAVGKKFDAMFAKNRTKTADEQSEALIDKLETKRVAAKARRESQLEKVRKGVENRKALSRIVEAYEEAENLGKFKDYMLETSDFALTQERVKKDKTTETFLRALIKKSDSGAKFEDFFAALPVEKDYLDKAA